MRAKISFAAGVLVNAQLRIALGEAYLYRRDHATKEVTIIEDPDVIAGYLAGTLDDEGEYFYIASKPANNQAIANLLDRAFGKPTESVKLANDPENPITTPADGNTAQLAQAFRAFIAVSTKSQPNPEPDDDGRPAETA